MDTFRTAIVAVFGLIALIVIGADNMFAETAKPLAVKVWVDGAQPAVSPEGFTAGSNVWVLDSVKDLKKAFDGKQFSPNKTCPGTKAKYSVAEDPSVADVTLTVAARGTSAAELGQRTTMNIYRGVVLADTVPTVGVTRWVSMVLSVDTYRQEFVAWSTNRSRFSAGAWRADTNLLARMAACWVMVNQPKILERRAAHK